MPMRTSSNPALYTFDAAKRAGHVHQVVIIHGDPLFAAGNAGFVGRFGAGSTGKGIDEGGFAHIGNAHHHHTDAGTDHAFFAAALHQGGKFFFNGAFDCTCLAALFGVHGQAASPGTFEVSQPLGSDIRVRQVGFIHNIQVRLAGGDAFNFRVQAGKRDARIQNL